MRFTVTIDVAQGDDTDEQVATWLTRRIDVEGLEIKPTGRASGNGHPEWQVTGNLQQVVGVLATFVGITDTPANALMDQMENVTEVFDPNFTPDA